MSMSTHVIALGDDSNETYQKHKKVLLACLEAEVELLPRETADYFGHNQVDPSWLEEKLRVEIKVRKWDKEEMCEGYEIDVKDIPPEAKIIRFYNSY